MPKILAIDDINDNLIILKALINDAFPGSIVYTAQNGPLGIELAIANDPDVILLDILMPAMDGFEVCTRLKQDKRVCEIPVVFITALKGDNKNRIKALEAGAEAFLAKPIDDTELTAQIRAMVKIKTANVEKHNEKERLTALVLERTRQLQQELEERKKAEVALTKSEGQLRGIFENLQDSYFQADLSGKFTIATPSAIKMYGYSIEEMIGQSADLLYAEPQERILLLAELRKTGRIEDFVCKGRKKDGTTFWTSMNVQLIYTNDGQILGTEGVVRDINERIKAERALIESEETTRTLLNGLPESTFLLDLQGNIIAANSTVAKRIGYSLEELKGHNIYEFVPPEIANRRKQAAEQVIQTGQPIYFEDEINGHFIDNRIHPIFGQDGQIHRLAFIGMDITKRKLAEERQRESEEKFAKVFHDAPVLIAITDMTDATYLDINNQALKVSGFSREEVIGHTAAEIGWISADDRAMLVRNVLENGLITDMEMEFHAKDGRLIHGIVKGEQLVLGGRYCLLTVTMDITDRKKAEILLKQSEELYRLLAYHMTDTIWMMNLNLITTYISPSVEILRGYTLEEIQQLPLDQHLTPSSYQLAIQTFSEEMTKVLKDPSYYISLTIELEFYRKDGTTYWSENTFSLIRDEKGNPLSILGEGRDITKRKQSEFILQEKNLQLIEAKEKAEESDRLKSDFLANMSHEIRTPLNSIIGFSDLMLDPFFGPGQHTEFAGIIKENGNKLLTIISDIMDLSKIEAGQVQVKKQLFSVNQLIANIQKEYSFKAIEKGIDFRLVQFNPKEEIDMASDENKLKQILINLVGNAIKFTEEGSIEIGIKTAGDFIQFHVKDTGIGISAKYHDQIFERFRQVESAFSRKYGGNGLGLPISKSLVELLGGKIWMESEQGKGSTFYFTMPL